jgi:hypothetical protein
MQLRRRSRRLQGCAPPKAGIKRRESAPAASRFANRLQSTPRYAFCTASFDLSCEAGPESVILPISIT